VRRARILGPAGSLEVSGSELRQRLGLRSTFVTFRLQPPSAVPESGGASSAPPESISGSLRRLLAADLPPPPPPSSVALPSLLVSGRGFGHGVGMSQWGAHALALRGEDYRRILSHYYRGAELRTLPSP
jgi:stage II sporulation protein D